MTFNRVATEFAHDGYFQAVMVVIVVDVLLGIAAALKRREFKFSWLSAFARDDLLGKVFPWFIIYTAAKYAPNVAVVGIDLTSIEKVVWGAVVVALGGSLLSSLKDLGVPIPEPNAIPKMWGGEREPPPQP